MKKTALVGALLSLALAYPVFADVTWEEETKVDGMMKMMSRAQKTVNRISGDKMRVDNDGSAQIIDIGSEKIYTLDTKKKTFSVMTFEEMRQRMEEGMAKAKQGMQREKREGGDEVSAQTDVQVTDTGNQQTIGSYSCKQYLMEMDIAVEDQESDQDAGFSTLTELWLTKEAPGVEEMNAFHRKMAEKLGTTAMGPEMLSGGGGESQMFGANMQEMIDEMKKLDGFTIRSVFYFGSHEAAKKEALGGSGGEEEKEEEKGGGFGGFLKKMTPVPGAGGAGGGIMMKSTTDVKTIHTKPIEASLFTVPENYKQVEQ